MDSAALRQAKIEIYKLVGRTTDYGIYADDLTYVYTTRAGYRYDNQQRIVENDEIYYPINITFYVRAYVPVENDSVIKWDNKYWRVISALKDKYYNNIVINAELINE